MQEFSLAGFLQIVGVSCSPREDSVAGSPSLWFLPSPFSASPAPDFSGIPGAAPPPQPVPVQRSCMVLTGVPCPLHSLQLSRWTTSVCRGVMPWCVHPQGITLSFWPLSKMKEVAALSPCERWTDQQEAQRVTLNMSDTMVSGLLHLLTAWEKLSFLHSMNSVIPKVKFAAPQLQQYLRLVLAQGGVAYMFLLPPSTQTHFLLEAEN